MNRLLLLLLPACAATPQDKGEGSPETGNVSVETGDSGSELETLDDCAVVDGRPKGWQEASHGKLDTPGYESVFATDTVHNLTIRMSAADLSAIYADMESLTGQEFGSGDGGSGGGGPGGGGPGGGEIPDEVREVMAEACSGLAEGDTCTVDLPGMGTTEGTCTLESGDLQCLPEGGPGGGDGGGGAATDILGADPIYVSVDVQQDGLTWCGVGMRLKGNATLSQTWAAGVGKLPFRLNFDKYEDERPEIDDQRFFGFEELSFANGQGDDSLLRETLAGEILEAQGIPAAKRAFYRIYLDTGEGTTYLGLYTMLEDPSDKLMARIWGTNDGNLYKPDGDCADLTCFDEETFEKKTNEEAADYSDVQALMAALNADRSDAAAWRAGLEARLDVDTFLHWLAVNSAMENWDTYGGLAHNYYLYAVPDAGGRFAWIPWDHNLALAPSMQGSDDPLLADVGEEWPLIHHVLADPVYNATYRAYLANALGGAYELDTLTARAETLANLLQPALFGEEGEVAGYTFLTSEADYQASVAELVAHVATRRGEVEAALAP